MRQIRVEECDVPVSSQLERSVVESSYFRDAYRVPLMYPQANAVEIFFGVFGHQPIWIKALLLFRNCIASICGLDVPAASDILNPKVKSRYDIGDTIGPWPIYSLTESELIAGRDNKHIDFRLSVLRETHMGKSCAVISTVCTIHNVFGKIYLRGVIPFHKWGVRFLISKAAKAHRI